MSDEADQQYLSQANQRHPTKAVAAHIDIQLLISIQTNITNNILTNDVSQVGADPTTIQR